MDQQIAGTSSVVAFRNCQGVDGQGTLLYLTRNAVVFEVYNPYSIVQTSEVLQVLRVLRGERTIYSGRAVVSNILATGLMLIVSATLVDPWSDLVGIAPGKGLREETERFLHDWEAGHELRASYRLAVGSIRAFLGELSQWLEQTEVATGIDDANVSAEMKREFVQEVRAPLESRMDELYETFEHEASQVPPDDVMPHKAHARREIHPFIMCSPFLHRTFSKPLGYAGDYEMVNMMVSDPIDGSSNYARLLNSYHLKSAPVTAHRNRIEMLMRQLKAEAKRAIERGGRCRVLNLGCGPAAEIREFMLQDSISDRCEFHLLDFDKTALAHVDSWIKETAVAAGRRPSVNLIHKSVHQLLKGVARREAIDPQPFDFVYCAGLFDYLSDRVCVRLLECFVDWVNPGGLVVVTNVHPMNPIRYFMEYLTEWHLIYRDETALSNLAPRSKTKNIRTDPSGVNVFLEIRREEPS